MSDFINDDQETETSVTTLTVQIFTVKSIAQILLEEENAFFFLITFYRNQLAEHVDDAGVLCLETWMEEVKNEYSRNRTVLTLSLIHI